MSKTNYALTSGAGLFYDDETGLKVLPGRVVGIDKTGAGRKTNQAILSGGLVEVSEKVSNKKETPKETEVKTDLPKDFPGFDVLVKEGVGMVEINQIPEDKRAEELAKIKGIGAKTVDAILAYLKK